MCIRDRIRRVTTDRASKHMIMKSIRMAKKDHRRQVLDWQVKDIIQNPRKGRCGKNSDPPGVPSRR
eukprot:7032727-Alexandrium_andersonii.AAC.1